MKQLYASQAASAALSVPGRRQAPGIGPGFIRTEFLTTGQGLLEHERGDYELIAQVTGQLMAWVVPQGDVP
jgi:hypothetical protein